MRSMDEYNVQTYIPQATFTVTLGSLIENAFDLNMSDYPIFDESYRATLNGKIFSHYWFREIGQETPGLFRYMLNRKMNEIMPYYNELYKTTLMELDPLSNYQMTTTNTGTSEQTSVRENKHDETSNSSSNSSSDSTSTGRTLNSATPQMQLSGHDDYATNLTDTTSSATTQAGATDTTNRELTENDQAKTSSVQDYVTKVVGLSGITQADAIMKFRQSLLNIDMLVIDELSTLFFGLYTVYNNYE